MSHDFKKEINSGYLSMQTDAERVSVKLTSPRSSRRHACHRRKGLVRSQSRPPACPLAPSAGHVSRTTSEEYNS